MKKTLILSLTLFFILLLTGSIFAQNFGNIYIRVNQLGFLPTDFKTAVIFSTSPVITREFSVKNLENDKIVFSGSFEKSIHSYDKFKYCYEIDFSGITSPGRYKIIVQGKSSTPFSIDKKVYNNLADSLMTFFRVQRCGPTNPYLHKPCHLSDVVRVIGDPKAGAVDATGGWHDAGDYIKFLLTTSYTTYMLLFSYEYDPVKFGFDYNNDGVPDILEEAKVGLDWMLRANYSKYKLITQVQNLRDHDVGWRMPSKDTLQYDRPGYVGMGKNQIGLFAAAMAMGSRIWSKKFFSYAFAKKCLNAAENLFSIRNRVPDVDKSESGVYQDKTFLGKLALGAIELYLTTNNKNYLNDAKTYADSAGSDYWWSWGNINSLADYRIAKISPEYSKYIYNNLLSFDTKMDSSVFREGLAYTWGTTNSLLGVALQAILYKNLTGSNRFDSLATYQRDYVLGRNPWGLSFIYGIGTYYPQHLHSQVAYFHGGYLPGALSAGPAPENILKYFKLKSKNHKYDYFNTKKIKYYDDRFNYITNEPTITGNATAVFVYGFYANR